MMNQQQSKARWTKPELEEIDIIDTASKKHAGDEQLDNARTFIPSAS